MSTRRQFLATVAAALAGSAHAAGGVRKTLVLQSAWDTINIGDVGHTPGTLRVLEEHLPDVPIVLWAMALDESVSALLKRRFPRVEIIQGSLAGKSARDEKLRRVIAECGLFVRNSGMGQNTDFMEFCRERGVPWGLFGQSYFPNMVEGEGAEQRIRLLNSAAFIYCRDSRTLATLRRAGVAPPVLEFGPDGCFGIDVVDVERGGATLRRLGLGERPFITLQLRTHTAKHEGKDNPPLNPLHPTPQQVADDERRAAKLRDLVTRWVRHSGGQVLLAPEVKKEMIHNKRLIYDLLPAEIQRHVVNLDTFWTVDEAAAVFARAAAAVCHEPHSLIIALANGTPILHTYSEFHSPKCWMFEDIGLGEWLQEIDDTPVERMAQTLFAIHDDPATARAQVRRAMDFVRGRFAQSTGVLRRLV